MSKRVNPEFVRRSFEGEGYTLLAPYKTSKVKLSYRCPKGHEHQVLWPDWNGSRKRRCPHCNGGIAFTHDQIASEFRSKGFELLTQYKNNRSRLDYICPKGHKHYTTLQAWKQGCGCAICAGKYLDANINRQRFEAEGYKLTAEYLNSRTKVSYICPNGHEGSITPNGFQQGKRCCQCSLEQGTNKQRLTQEHVEEGFKEAGFIVNGKYVNSGIPIEVTCPKGHKAKLTWDRLKQGRGCPECGKINRHLNRRNSHNDIEKAFADEGYKLLAKYELCDKPVKFLCPKGHEHQISWEKWKAGQRCAKCVQTGFNPDKPGTLYYIRFDIDGEYLYKIGITNRTVQERFRLESRPFQIISETRYLFGFMAYEEEQKILKKYKNKRYQGVDVLVSGNTELFREDVLRRDKTHETA